MIFGRKLRNTDAKQMLDHINYMQDILEREFEKISKEFSKVEAKTEELNATLSSITAEEETEG